jgi:hypothetical protein
MAGDTADVPPLFDFTPHLEPAETLFWSGRPSPFSHINPMVRLFLLLWIVGVAFVGLQWREVGGDLSGFVVCGLMLAAGTWMMIRLGPADRALRARTTYAVTSLRVLRADDGGKKIRGRDLREIVAVEVHRSAGGGTVRFRVAGDGQWVDNDGRFALPLESPLPAFHDIADATEVAALVNRLRAEMDADPARRERRTKMVPQSFPE